MDTFCEMDIANNFLCNHRPPSLNSPEGSMYNGEENDLKRYTETDNPEDRFVGLPVVNRMTHEQTMTVFKSKTLEMPCKYHMWTLRATNNGVSNMYDFYSKKQSSQRRYSKSFGWLCDYRSSVVGKKIDSDGNINMTSKTYPSQYTKYADHLGQTYATHKMVKGKLKEIKHNDVYTCVNYSGDTFLLPEILSAKCAYFSTITDHEIHVPVSSVQNGTPVMINKKKYAFSKIALAFFHTFSMSGFVDIQESMQWEIENGADKREKITIPSNCLSPFMVTHSITGELVPLVSRQLIYSEYHKCYLLDFDAIRLPYNNSVVSKAILGVRKTRKITKLAEDIDSINDGMETVQTDKKLLNL